MTRARSFIAALRDFLRGFVGATRQDDDGNGSQVGKWRNHLTNREARAAGHIHVEDDQVGLQGIDLHERRHPVVGPLDAHA